MGGQRGYYLIRIIVAGYLIYLGIKLIRDMLSGAEAENPVLFILVGIAFIAVSVFLIVWSIKGMMKAQQEEREAAEAEAEEEERQKAAAAIEGGAEGDANADTEAGAEETAAQQAQDGPLSIADRIRMLSGEPEEGETEESEIEENKTEETNEEAQS